MMDSCVYWEALSNIGEERCAWLKYIVSDNVMSESMLKKYCQVMKKDSLVNNSGTLSPLRRVLPMYWILLSSFEKPLLITLVKKPTTDPSIPTDTGIMHAVIVISLRSSSGSFQEEGLRWQQQWLMTLCFSVRVGISPCTPVLRRQREALTLCHITTCSRRPWTLSLLNAGILVWTPDNTSQTG